MDPKPLTKEADAEIAALRQYVRESPRALRTIDAILGAEQFWREAVKNAKPFTNTSGGEYSDYCAFCDHGDWKESQHKPDCPWLLSQDPK